MKYYRWKEVGGYEGWSVWGLSLPGNITKLLNGPAQSWTEMIRKAKIVEELEMKINEKFALYF